jgi:hypothetical protein
VSAGRKKMKCGGSEISKRESEGKRQRERHKHGRKRKEGNARKETQGRKKGNAGLLTAPITKCE